VRILVASLTDVIRSKEAEGREKDRQALPRLRQLLARIGSAKRRRGPLNGLRPSLPSRAMDQSAPPLR
jgi:hypothetical protein